MKSNANATAVAARAYLEQGIYSIPLAPRSKRPILKNWQNLRLELPDIDREFANGRNIGMLLGAPSGGLFDTDLDCSEARSLAEFYLPPTGAVFGRNGAPNAHRLYLCNPGDFRTVQFADPTAPDDKAMLVELRGTGSQTMAPPSIHPSSERVEWSSRGKPTRISYDGLLVLVKKVAAGALLARYWTKGERNKTALALAGALLRSGWSEQEVSDFIYQVARAARDEEAEARRASVRATAKKYAKGEPITGQPTCAEIFGEQVWNKAAEWLGLQTTALMRVEQGYREGRKEPAVSDRGDPWSKAKPAPEFVTAPEDRTDWLVENIIARESLTIAASPRGLGKTNYAHYLAIELATGGCRVLIVDRDNPKREIRRRLIAWGAARAGDKLKILTRDDAPALTDKAAWAAFPFAEYDVVILDSFSAASEGVEEREGGASGAAIAPLLDNARRGPGVLILANCRKDAAVLRGSGVLADRADIVYEVRDGTDLKLEAKHEVWWEALPPAADSAWASRAKRRRRRESYRLALVPSKFRIGEEPDPRMIEIRLPEFDAWSVADVTSEVERSLEDAKRQAADAEQARVDAAAVALRTALEKYAGPVLMNDGALELLVNQGLSRDRARQLLKDRDGRDWRMIGSGKRNDPYRVFVEKPSAGIRGNKTDRGTRASKRSIPAGTVPQGPQESASKNGSAPRTSASPNSCGGISVKASKAPDARPAAPPRKKRKYAR